MSKTFSIALILVLVVSSLLVTTSLPFGTAQSGTNESGIISSDTTWTRAGSPYNLTGNVLISSGTTITVEKGTTLNFNGYYIMVNGSLIIHQGVTINMQDAAYIQVNGVLAAIGTNINPININGFTESFHIQTIYYSSIIFSKGSTSWNQQTSTGSILENAILNMVSVSVSSSVELTNNTFLGGGIGVSEGSPLITDNVVKGGLSLNGGSPVISNNTILSITCMSSGLPNTFLEGQTAIIVGNIISGGAFSGTGISLSGESLGCNVLIERNLINGNRYAGIDISMSNNVKCTALIINNTITNNGIGIYVVNGYPLPISNNNIYDNAVNVKLSENNNIDCANNWWGTIDQQAINQTIHDNKNDFNLGTVNFIPFLTAPNPQAPIINRSIPTPTQSPISTQTPSPSPTPTPSVPEFSWLTILPILLCIGISLVTIRKRITKKLITRKQQ